MLYYIVHNNRLSTEGEMMSDIDLDTILAIIGNPTRRSILRKLARETHYPLQLSKELNISQQAIMKHLKILEDNDLVISILQKSDAGPPRKLYSPTRRFSIVIDISPSTFNEEIRVYEIVEERKVLGSERDKLDLEEMSEKREELIDLATSINEINLKISDLEHQRKNMMQEKEDFMKRAYELMGMLCTGYDERKVLRYILEEDNISISKMSERLNMREMDIERIMRRLEDMGLLEFHRKIIYV